MGRVPYTVRSKLNKFEHVWGRGPCTVRSKLNMSGEVPGPGAVQREEGAGSLYRLGGWCHDPVGDSTLAGGKNLQMDQQLVDVYVTCSLVLR